MCQINAVGIKGDRSSQIILNLHKIVLLQASCKLAAEKKETYETYEGSPASKGVCTSSSIITEVAKLNSFLILHRCSQLSKGLNNY